MKYKTKMMNLNTSINKKYSDVKAWIAIKSFNITEMQVGIYEMTEEAENPKMKSISKIYMHYNREKSIKNIK